MSREEVMEKYKQLLKRTVIRGDVPSQEALEIEYPIFKYINDLLPKSLYRYRSFSKNSFSALLEDKVYFSKPKDFNDPHDCLSYIAKERVNQILEYETNKENILAELKKMRASPYFIESDYTPNILEVAKLTFNDIKSMSEDKFNYIINNLSVQSARQLELLKILNTKNRDFNLQMSREEIGIACFSEDITSTLMWSHYADYHRGFALKYNTQALKNLEARCDSCAIKCDASRVVELYPVVYDDERYDATEYEIETLKWMWQYMLLNKKLPFITPDRLHLIKANTFKSSAWKYEKEWRLVFSAFEVPEKWEIVRPQAIYFGSQMSEETKNIILENIKGKEMEVYQMFVDDNKKEYCLSEKLIIQKS